MITIAYSRIRPLTDKIQKLTDFMHARRRTEMYLSSRDPHTQTVLEYDAQGPKPVDTTWVPAVFTAYRELLDNALDEIVTHGHGDRLDITYDPKTTTFSIADNGRGIPIDFDPAHNTYLATMALTETKAGRNFGDRGASRGLNGVGASVVNFCSTEFNVEINRDGKSFSQRFHEGDGKNVDLIIDDPIILPQSNRKLHGTKVTARLSPKVFHDLRLPENFMVARVAEIALCYPNLKITYNGFKVASKGVSSLFPGRTPTTFRIDEPGFHSQFWLVANFMADGSEYQHSMVNAIPTFNGGTHIEAFRKGFFSGLLNALERESKRRRLSPNRSDLADGMLLYNVTQMDEPQFDSQSKTRLINENVAGIVRKTLDDPDFFKKVIRDNKSWIDAVYARCAERTMKKDNADVSKLAKKNLRQKIEDLEDACGLDRSKCVLFLGEGRCLRDDTQIMVFKDGSPISVPISEATVGDIVLTHTGSLKPITAVWRKTSQGIVLKCSAGSIVASPTHRLLVHDRSDNKFGWLEMKDIDPSCHRLVRSKLVDVSHVEEILSINEIDEGPYQLKIVFGRSPKGLRYELASRQHEYAVIDLITMRFTKVKAGDLDIDRHAIMMRTLPDK